MVRDVVEGELLYQNPLAGPDDVAGFRLEGTAAMTFPRGRLRLEGLLDPDEDAQAANHVLWLPVDFPSDIIVSWDFWPIHEPGLGILFFAATGRAGEDIFDPALAERTGPYDQYHHGDINAYHVSYFRRRWPAERALHVSNLRKSYGFHLVAQGPDPIPPVADAEPPYRLQLIKAGDQIRFSINGLESFRWDDDGSVGGPALGGGKIGLRQMAPLIAEYSDLTVHRAVVA